MWAARGRRSQAPFTWQGNNLYHDRILALRHLILLVVIDLLPCTLLGFATTKVFVKFNVFGGLNGGADLDPHSNDLGKLRQGTSAMTISRSESTVATLPSRHPIDLRLLAYYHGVLNCRKRS